MINTSGLFPEGHCVLLKPYEVKKSVIELPDAVSARQRMLETRAIVIAVGDASWMEEPRPRAVVGQHVMFSRLCGEVVIGPLDNETYRAVNDRDIYMTINPPEDFK